MGGTLLIWVSNPRTNGKAHVWVYYENTRGESVGYVGDPHSVTKLKAVDRGQSGKVTGKGLTCQRNNVGEQT